MLTFNLLALLCALLPLSLALPNASPRVDDAVVQRRQLTRAKLVELAARDPARRAAPSGIPASTAMETIYTAPGLQRISLPAGRYNLAAWGARGGSARAYGGGESPGGTAANINVTISLDMPTGINLVIGSVGTSVYPTYGGGGGGGGTFVYTPSGVAILVAGGGGGAAFNGGGQAYASATTSGSNGRGIRPGMGGMNGLGGSSAGTTDRDAGGGAGFFSGATPASLPASGRSQPGFQGGMSATGSATFNDGGPFGVGGVGGGGGGADNSGGGGGGYSGGGSGENGQGGSGGGGGSFTESPYRLAGSTISVAINYAGSGKVYIFGPY